MRIRRAIGTAASAAALAGLAFGGLASASTPAARTAHRHHASANAGLAGLYQKALAAKQTNVVIYGPSAASDGPLYKAFEKAFPKITITGVPVVGPPMSAKLAAEFASGKHVADIAYTGSTNMLQYAHNGWFSYFRPKGAPPNSKLPKGSVGPKGAFWGASQAVSGTIYNTNDLKASQVPRTWNQIASPKWKNKLGMYDPTAVGLMADVFAHLAKVRGGAAIMRKLHAQNVELFPSSNVTGPLNAVAQGAKQIGVQVPFGFYLVAHSAGAPLGFRLLKTDNYTVMLYQGLIKGAPHPLAAKLWESWLYTPEAAKTLASEGSYSVIPHAPAPKGLPAFAKIKQMPFIPLTGIPTADNNAISQAKKIWGN